MSRNKNVISKNVLEVGNPDSLKKAADRVGRQASDLRQHLRVAVPQTAGVIRTQVVKPMLEKLGIYPPRWIGMKMRWKSAKQRRYVMMKLRAEGNLPRKRTFKLRQGWVSTVEVDTKNGAIKVTVENTATSPDSRGRMTRYQPFVSGDIGLGVSRRSMQRYDKPIQPFHKDRGWNPAAPIIQQYYALSIDKAEEFLGKIIIRIIRRQ